MTVQSLKLIVGLGNPGEEYACTRHNAGFWFIDELARRHAATLRHDRRHQGEVARARIGSEEIWLLKPMTYMNRSGGPLRALADFYKISPPEILVAHDELDLPVGTVRLKLSGGAGGHNGLRDTIARIGEGFWRMRIGIGHPGEKSEVVDYVLRRAPAEEDSLIRGSVATAVEIVPALLEDGAQKAMNTLHTR